MALALAVNGEGVDRPASNGVGDRSHGHIRSGQERIEHVLSIGDPNSENASEINRRFQTDMRTRFPEPRGLDCGEKSACFRLVSQDSNDGGKSR